MFLLAKNSTLGNYAGNNTQFFCEKTFDQVISNLQTYFRTLKVWFYDNLFFLNPKNAILWLLEMVTTFATFHVIL